VIDDGGWGGGVHQDSAAGRQTAGYFAPAILKIFRI
jgi:hypothetical protein